MSTISSLYRSMLRESRKIADYNFRSYANRRVKLGFDKNRSLVGENAELALQEGQTQLQLLKRQAMISQMYPSATSVMEKL
mmetsp:Transcript_27305/g.31169  ORF Transcript_27305/g.31169 Transcript_27305/m.31169 type:complete len:81 (-) Transcript_27305:215-457(-)